MKTFYCVTYSLYADKEIKEMYLSVIEIANEMPVNSVQERKDFSVYHEWYESLQKAINFMLETIGCKFRMIDEKTLVMVIPNNPDTTFLKKEFNDRNDLIMYVNKVCYKGTAYYKGIA